MRDIIKEKPSYLEGRLIISIFELSNLDPISFVKNLKVYKLNKKNLKPSVILDLLKRNTKFVQRKKFNEIISRFNDFIEKCIPNNSKQEAKKNLDKLEKDFPDRLIYTLPPWYSRAYPRRLGCIP